MLLVDDLAAGGTKNLRHTPRGLVTLKAIAYHIKTSICLCNNDLSNPSNYDKHNNLQPSLLVAPWETFHAFCGLSADFFFF